MRAQWRWQPAEAMGMHSSAVRSAPGRGYVPLRGIPAVWWQTGTQVATGVAQLTRKPVTALPRSLASHLELGAAPAAAARARQHAREVVCAWELPALADTSELIVSELVTNAVAASRGLTSPAIRLWLSCDLTALVIHVWDGSNEMPARKDPSLDDESGRGLLLVESLSKDWGAYRTVPGKVVWAKLTTTETAWPS
jgi:anti-sigma regulatory factor (Ser/Thr protein kinase)